MSSISMAGHIKSTLIKRGFESYFVSFESGPGLRLMQMAGIPDNLNDPVEKQYHGIIHLSFRAGDMEMVNKKCHELMEDGLKY